MARKLGRAYELDAPIGRGAMGEVWRGRNTESGDAVAAKLLRSEYTADQEVLQRFVQERSILLSVRHPNLVQVRDLVVEGSDVAIVMDLVEGGDLRSYVLERGRLPPGEAVKLVAQALDALAVIHASRVFHRDIKPENVLLDRSNGQPVPKLSDFGIARLAEGTAVRMSQLIGTPDYLAPEVISAEIVTPAADVYACGVMLYELLAGRTPFSGQGTPAAILLRQVSASPPPLQGVPPALEAVIDLLLVKDPSVRPDAASAAAMLRELLPELAGLPALPEQAPVRQWQEDAPRNDDGEGGTIIKGRSITGPEPLDEAPIWTPAVDGEVDSTDRGTRAFVRKDYPRHVPLPPKPPDGPVVPPPDTKNRRTMLIGAGAFVGMVVVVMFFVMGRGDTASEENTRLAADSSVQGASDRREDSFGLLDVARSYRLEPEEGANTFRLTGEVSYRPRSGNLQPTGRVLEVLPKKLLEASQEQVSWSRGEATPAGAEEAGSSRVSWSLPIDGGDDTFEFTLGGIDLGQEDPTTALTVALSEVNEDLSRQLKATSVEDDSMWLLAVESLVVESEGAVSIGSGPIDYSVKAVLPNDDKIPLYEVKDGGSRATDFLDSLGGVTVLTVKVDGPCVLMDGLITPSHEGACQIDATLGDLYGSDHVSVLPA